MSRPDERAADLEEKLVDHLADFDELLQDDDDLPMLVTRLRQTQRLLHQLGRNAVEAARQTDGAHDTPTTAPDGIREIASSPPKRVGKFRLVRELGRGGCGIVFLAHDERLDREVALKLPQPAVLLDEAARARFLREAKAVASLDHRHIVPVLEAGEDGYLCYMASAYCSGPTLAQWLRDLDEPPTIGLVAEIVANLAQAAAHAHTRGVMHRDIKPGNVLLFDDREQSSHKDEGKRVCFGRRRRARSSFPAPIRFVPKLTDFGLAKVVLDDASHTRTGQMMGTAAYMAPEQADAAGSVGPTADVYSLGVILYELLTGRPVFQGEGPFETLELARRDDPVPPSRLRSGVPRDLETICLKCLAKAPVRRYPNGQALADDLARFLKGEPIHARRAGTLERTWRWCLRKPLAAGLIATTLSLAAILFIGFATAAVLFRDAERQQSSARELAERRLFDALLARAGMGRLSNEPGRRFAALASVTEASELAQRLTLGRQPQLTLRNEAIACLALMDLKCDARWSAYPRGSDTTGIAVDAAVERYAMYDNGAIVVRRLRDNHVVARLTDLGSDNIPGTFRATLRFSPDGKKLGTTGSEATYAYGAIPCRVWDIETGRALLSVPAEGPWHNYDLDFTSDSATCGVGFADGSVRMFDLRGKAEPRALSSGSPANILRFDPAGGRVAIGRQSPSLEIINVTTGETVLARHSNRLVQCLEWSPDGTRLAYGVAERVYVLEPGTGGCHRWIGHHADVVSVAFHPNGHVLTSSGFDGKTRLWDLRTNRSMLAADGTATRFSSDGSYLGFGSVGHEIGRWQVAPATECRLLGRFELNAAALSLGFHGSERLLAVATVNGVNLFDLTTGALLTTVPSGKTRLAQFVSSKELLVVTEHCVQRWPIEATDDATLQVAVGDPQPVKTPAAMFGNSSLSVGGQNLLVETLAPPNAAMVPVFGGETRWLNLPAWGLALSPDEQWLAATYWHGQTELYDLKSHSYVRALPGHRARAVFSPDGKWLVLGTGGEYWILETANWTTVAHFERKSAGVGLAAASFSADSRMLALTDNPATVTLLQSGTWRELATLTPPNPAMFTCCAVSDDSHWLAATSSDGCVFVWDIARIRAALADLRLDW